MIEIKILDYAGNFAENKDIGKKLRLEKLIPALEQNEEIIIDFEGVDGATQSFIHTLISDLFRKYSNKILENISFKNCNSSVKEIISIVSEYMQEA